MSGAEKKVIFLMVLIIVFMNFVFAADFTATNPKGSYTFVAYGDTGFIDCSNETAIRDAIPIRINSYSPDFVMHLGDMTCNARASDWVAFNNSIAQLRARQPPEGLPLSFFPAVGNHDNCKIPTSSGCPYIRNSFPFLKTLSDYGRSTVSNNYYSFAYGDSYFIILDTQVPFTSGDQNNWIKNELSIAQNYRDIFLFNHESSYFSSYKNCGNTNLRSLLNSQIALGKRITAFFSGHEHSYLLFDCSLGDGDCGDTKYITSGGGGQLMVSGTICSDSQYGYDVENVEYIREFQFMKVDIEGDYINVSSIDENGYIIDNFQISRFSSTCTPGSCEGRECGTYANGTCSGTLNCGTCSEGYNCVSGRCVEAGDVTMDLQLWLKMDDEISDGSALDSSGNGNSGVCLGSSCPIFLATEGHDGSGAYQFDGATDWLDAGTSKFGIDSSQEFTVSAWIKITGDGPSTYDVILTRGKYIRPFAIEWYKAANRLRFSIRNSAGVFYFNTYSSSVPIDSQWRHVVLTRSSAGAVKIYLNGALVTQGSVTGNLYITSADKLAIGSSGSGGYFKGMIDELRIYNRSLSESEIQNLYNSSIPSCTPHASYACYSGDVYWYDSCDVREEKKQDCTELESCENGQCVTPPCTPYTCASQGYNCGIWQDGCEGTINCGSCSEGYDCVSGVCQLQQQCIPTTCALLGKGCGNGYANGTCAGTLDCGSCSEGYDCVDGICTATESNLQLWLKFDDDINDGVAVDSSGQGNNGVCSESICPVYLATEGHDGSGAYQFDGATDWLDIGTSKLGIDASKEFTISAWIKITGDGPSTYDVILTRGKYIRPFAIEWYKAANRLRLAVRNSAQVYYFNTPSNSVPIDSQWRYVVLTRDSAGFVKIYLDGALSTQGSVTGSLYIPSGEKTTIGSSGTGGYFKGIIDDLRVYNRALSESEVQSLYQ